MFRTQIYRLSRDIKYYVQDSLIVARKEEGVPSSLMKTTSTKGRLLRRAGVAYVQIFPPLFFILFHSPLHGGKKNSSIGVSERTGERGKRRTRGGKNGRAKENTGLKGKGKRERDGRMKATERKTRKVERKERKRERVRDSAGEHRNRLSRTGRHLAVSTVTRNTWAQIEITCCLTFSFIASFSLSASCKCPFSRRRSATKLRPTGRFSLE